MNIVVTGKNFEITEALHERIDKKVGKLSRYMPEDKEILVRLSQERGNRNTVEITILFDGVTLRAEETSNDMYASVDRCVDMVIRQIRRHRTKLEKRLRADAYAEFSVPGPEDVEEEAVLVRTKRFSMKPMSVEDAIAQMDMLGHNFYMFVNIDSDDTCVVYKRVDGNYGLIQPEN